MYALPILFRVIRSFFLIVKFRFETPKFYVMQGQIKKAKAALSKIYVDESIELELYKIKEDIKGS